MELGYTNLCSADLHTYVTRVVLGRREQLLCLGVKLTKIAVHFYTVKILQGKVLDID